MSNHISQLSVQAKAGTSNMPTVPVPSLIELVATLLGLILKAKQIEPALAGLTNTYRIGNTTATAYEFLFGERAANPLIAAVDEIHSLVKGNVPDLIRQILESGPGSSTQAAILPRPLDQPEQFSIGWTNYANVYKNAQSQLARWTSTLINRTDATKEFWPTIANYGFGYNLLFLDLVTNVKKPEFKKLFGPAWTSAMDKMQAEDRLYAIDLRIFENFPATAGSTPRFTPGTITLLEQDAETKALNPVTVRVSSQAKEVIYSANSASSGAWLYALQAAKTSATVYGIWLGHVYHLHIVTAAMLGTFHKNITDSDHPIYQLLQPRSDYLIGFDAVLLNLWDIAPPTSFDTPDKFLQLADRFASGRNFSDDDPKATIAVQALDVKKFTKISEWDLYPVAQQLLRIWNIAESLVNVFVEATYNSDKAVADDQPLQAWMKAAAAPTASGGGNVRGLPVMNTRQALKSVLTSVIYRITAHGISRMNNSVNPVLTFMANYPPCLQNAELPEADATLSTADLLKMLPWTNTMGEQLRFYYVFVFSPPYVPLIPPGGVTSDLPFPGGPEEKRNKAMIDFRTKMIAFIHGYDPAVPEQVKQWELNIET